MQANEVSLNKSFKGVSRLPPALLVNQIPVRFDRQGHSCNLYGCFGPTCCLLSESHLVTVLIASPAFCQPELCFCSQFSVAFEKGLICSRIKICNEHWFRAHTFSACWLWSSVVSVLINVITRKTATISRQSVFTWSSLVPRQNGDHFSTWSVSRQVSATSPLARGPLEIP